MSQAQTAEMKAEVANPFRPGNGVPPPYLAGRDRLIAEFEGFVDARPLHPNWTLTGLRGTSKTVLLNEFAARAERAGWLTLERELSERHRDDERFADAIDEDVNALIRRVDLLSGIGQRLEQGWRYLRPRRVSIGDLSVEPSYETGNPSPQDRMRAAFAVPLFRDYLRRRSAKPTERTRTVRFVGTGTRPEVPVS